MNRILEEIDKLKLMVVMEMAHPHKTELEMYEEWIDKMQGRVAKSNPFANPSDYIDPTQWAEYRTIKSLVEQLYYDKFGNDREYHEDKMKIKAMMAEIVAMTLYVQERKND